MITVGVTAVGVTALKNYIKFWTIINIRSTIILWWSLYNLYLDQLYWFWQIKKNPSISTFLTKVLPEQQQDPANLQSLRGSHRWGSWSRRPSSRSPRGRCRPQRSNTWRCSLARLSRRLPRRNPARHSGRLLAQPRRFCLEHTDVQIQKQIHMPVTTQV